MQAEEEGVLKGRLVAQEVSISENPGGENKILGGYSPDDPFPITATFFPVISKSLGQFAV